MERGWKSSSPTPVTPSNATEPAGTITESPSMPTVSEDSSAVTSRCHSRTSASAENVSRSGMAS